MNIEGLNKTENRVAEIVSSESLPKDALINLMDKEGWAYADVNEALDSLLTRRLLETWNGKLMFTFPKDNGSNQMSETNFKEMALTMLERINLGSGAAPAPNPYDPVNKPKGYNQGKISPADFIADQKLSFDRGSCVKYLCRAGVKEDPELTVEEKAIQDLSKAIWYLQHEIDWIKVNGL